MIPDSYPTCPDTGQLVFSHCTTWSSFLYLIAHSFCTRKEKKRREVYSKNQENITERRFCPSATVCPSVSVHSSPRLSVSTHRVQSSTRLPNRSRSCLRSPNCFCPSLHFHSPVHSCLLLHVQSSFLLPLHIHPIHPLTCLLAQQLPPATQIA